MASIIERIHAFRPALPPAAEKVAAACLRNPEDASRLAINELARVAGVSVATVSRLATTLGYRDWKDMRIALAQAPAGPAAPAPRHAGFPDILPRDSDEAVVRKVIEAHVLSLRDTLAELDPPAVRRVVSAVVKADRVVFFGAGLSAGLVRDEALRFARLGIPAEAYTEETPMVLAAARMRRGQVAFGFSGSGRTRSTVAALREARRRRALTVALSYARGSPLTEAGDILFHIVSPPTGGTRTRRRAVAFMTARIAVLGVMDALHLLVTRRGKRIPDATHLESLLERHVRLPARGSARPRAARRPHDD